MSHTEHHDEHDEKLDEIRKRIEAKKKELHDLEEQEKLVHERREKDRAARKNAPAPATTTTTTTPVATAPATNPAPAPAATQVATPAAPALSAEAEEARKKKLDEEEKREIEEATRIRREVRARAALEKHEKEKMIESHRHEEDKMRAHNLEEERKAREHKDHEAMSQLLEHEREKAREMPEKEHWDRLQHIFDEREKKEKAEAEKRAHLDVLVEPEWQRDAFAWFCDDDKTIILEQHPNFKYGQVAEKLRSDWLHLPANMKKMYEEKAQRDYARYLDERKKFDQKSGLATKAVHTHN